MSVLHDLATLWRHVRRSWLRPRSLGERGELAAMKFLKRKGYAVIAHSQKGRMGEIDLVAVDQRTVVFIEVKTRQSDHRGTPAEAVDDDKQKKLCRLAHTYLKRHNLLENPARFDVVGLTWPTNAKQPEIEHFVNAFDYSGPGAMF